MRRAIRSVAACAIAVASGAPPAVAVGDPIAVLAGPEDQLLPSANDAYLIWTQNSVSHPDRYHAYGRALGTSTRFRLDPPGAQGFSGAIDPDQDRAIYQRVDGGSDLYFFNLETRRQRRVSSPVNSARWERDPRLSNAFIFFARDAGGYTSLFLFDRIGKTMERIGRWDFTTYFVVPGAVGERYATWSVCRPLTCNAFVHDTQDDERPRTRIPGPDGRAQYAPVVSEEDDFVFFVRSGPACGSTVTIRRLALSDLDGPSNLLLDLPDGVDVEWSMSTQRADSGRLDLWFSRHRCAPEQGDLYKLRDVSAP